MNIFYCL